MLYGGLLTAGVAPVRRAGEARRASTANQSVLRVFSVFSLPPKNVIRLSSLQPVASHRSPMLAPTSFNPSLPRSFRPSLPSGSQPPEKTERGGDARCCCPMGSSIRAWEWPRASSAAGRAAFLAVAKLQVSGHFSEHCQTSGEIRATFPSFSN